MGIIRDLLTLSRHGGFRRPARLKMHRVEPERRAIFLVELESLRKQIPHGVYGLGDPPVPMGLGIGQQVIQLVRENARHGTAKRFLSLGGRHRDEIVL